ncbi:hypothetical protein ACLVWU_09765 [Bdellovibrio sp. HCB290]|uniref:hypothetical protein n=1 Tax=Bdellovibrio sp. HCB290 TaxID=3394356 RepID=UPI0039B5923D
MKNLTKLAVAMVLTMASVQSIAAQIKMIPGIQPEAIAITRIRALYVNEDVLSLVQYGIEAQYQIASITYLEHDLYKVSVRRYQPGQTCQQVIVLNAADGAVSAIKKAKCE